MPNIRSLRAEADKLRQLAEAKRAEVKGDSTKGSAEAAMGDVVKSLREKHEITKLENEIRDLERRAQNNDDEVASLEAEITQIEQQESEVNQWHNDELIRLDAETKQKLAALEREKARILG